MAVASTGDIYDYLWEDNVKNGLGNVLFRASGDFYKGSFQDNKMEGFGLYYEAAT